MHSLSAWFTKNPVAANLLMIVVLAAGILAGASIRIEGFPALPASSVTISTACPGLDAEQVDTGVSRRIEIALEGMPGVKTVSAMSFEGYSQVAVEKVSRFNLDRFQNEIQTRVDGIADFPKMTERPVISRDEFNVDALLVQVFGSTDTQTLQATARTVKQALAADPHIAKIDLFGLKTDEIRIEADEKKLAGLNLTYEDLSRAVKANSFYAAAGTLKSRAREITLKSDIRAFDPEGFKKIPMRTALDGRRILLGDVAKVIEGFSEDESFARFQGKPSIGMLIYTTPKGDLLEVSKAAHTVVDQIKKELPRNIRIELWGETSIFMKARLNLLKSNAIQGLFVVLIFLALFLSFRLAFWVAMGIPISICGALTLMGSKFFNYSLNDVTTFGLIIVLGILVDDAVVVGESVFEERKTIVDPIQGTISGVSKVSTATVFGCFTTLAAFYPPLLIDNDLGRIFASFSMVVIICLIVSLIESKLILPAHLAAVKTGQTRQASWINRIWKQLQHLARSTLEKVKIKIYLPLLKKAIDHRYTAFLLLITVSALVLGMAFNKTIKTVFFPDVPGQIIMVEMDMINGSPLDLTLKNINEIEKAAEELNKEVMAAKGSDEPPIVFLLSALNEKQTAVFYAELAPEKNRVIETVETLNRWQSKVKNLEGVHKLTFSGSFETAGGFEINVHVRNGDHLKPACDLLLARLKKINGVKNVYVDLDAGDPAMALTLKPEARHLGLTALDLAQFVGDRFGTVEIQRFLKNSEEIKVVARESQDKRRHISDLLDSRIRLSSGSIVPLSHIAKIESSGMPSGIFRKDGLRVATIKADLDKRLISPSGLYAQIADRIVPKLLSRYPDLTVKGAGELEEIGVLQKGLEKAFILVLIGIYALLAVPLKSYLQPVVIMSVIPFALVGSILGHYFIGLPLSILSFLGLLGACGVVVNDSLLMLTSFNDLITDGAHFKTALVAAGTSRFRAIFLTTATTVGGLAPLLFETSEQARYLIPAAVSLAFGELVATSVTLFLIPILLAVGEDIKKVCVRLYHLNNKAAAEKNEAKKISTA